MKKLIYIIVLLLNFSSYGQEVFEYEFDENISVNVLEDSEETEIQNGKLIKGTFENEVLTISSSNKVKNQVLSETGLLKLFQGIKDGNLNATKGSLINEEIIKLNNLKVSKFRFSFTLESQNKIVEGYAFVYKNIVYIFQFMNNENEFEKHTTFRKSILDSIKFK